MPLYNNWHSGAFDVVRLQATRNCAMIVCNHFHCSSGVEGGPLHQCCSVLL